MARTIETIRNEINGLIATYPSLSALNNSNASVFRMIVNLVSTAMFTFETLLDVFRSEITELSRDVSPGTERWFSFKSKEFQYDDTTPQILEVTDRTIQYPTIDDNLKIVTQASCISVLDSETNNASVFVKAAKGEIGSLEPLSTDELNAFRSYINQIKMAGQRLLVSSNQPDRLHIRSEIYYDGQFVKTQVQEDIREAINTYLSSVEFNGKIYFQRVVDAIQSVDGVQDVVIIAMAARDINTPITNRTRIIKDYTPLAGFMVLEDTVAENLENKTDYYVV